MLQSYDLLYVDVVLYFLHVSSSWSILFVREEEVHLIIHFIK